MLLVDDEPGVRNMLRLVLTKAGYATEEAEDGLQAIEQLARTPFDVIVTDVNMPGSSGLDFLKNVRDRDLDVPVIMLTGKPTVEASSSAVEHGAFRYLVKPVLPAVIRDAVERAIKAHDLAKLKRRALAIHSSNPELLTNHATLTSNFEKALDALFMVYQPIVSWSAKKPHAYEALVRSAEPALMRPDLLLDAALRLGRMTDLSRRIRASVIAPPDGADLFVNLHASDLEDEDLFDPQSRLCKMAPRVVLELTERATIDDVVDVEARIVRLRSLGFRIAIDDVGAGYAGLSSFTTVDPEVAKLDMSLIRNIDTHAKKQSIVGSMMHMCTELGVKVVAEGVETVSERDVLLGLGCDLLQGYLFAKPDRNFPTPRW